MKLKLDQTASMTIFAFFIFKMFLKTQIQVQEKVKQKKKLFIGGYSRIAICCSFPGSSDGKESACNAGVLGLIPELGRSPGEGNGNPLQYSCLENPMDRGTW